MLETQPLVHKNSGRRIGGSKPDIKFRTMENPFILLALKKKILKIKYLSYYRFDYINLILLKIVKVVFKSTKSSYSVVERLLLLYYKGIYTHCFFTSLYTYLKTVNLGL